MAEEKRGPSFFGVATSAVVFSAVGVLMAAAVVDGVSLAGGTGQQTVAILLAGVILGLGRSPFGMYQIEIRGPEGVGGPSGSRLARRILWSAARLFPLWLADRACRAAGLPLHISSFWPLVWAATVVVATESVLRAGRRLVLQEEPAGALGELTRPVLAAFATWLASHAVGGFHLAAGPWWRQALVLLVVGWMFEVPDPKLRLRQDADRLLMSLPLAAILAVGVNTLMLWFVGWLSTALRLRLHTGGAEDLVLAALAVTGFLWLVQLPSTLVSLGVVAAISRAEWDMRPPPAGADLGAHLQHFMMTTTAAAMAGAPVRAGRFGVRVGSGAVRLHWGRRRR